MYTFLPSVVPFSERSKSRESTEPVSEVGDWDTACLYANGVGLQTHLNMVCVWVCACVYVCVCVCSGTCYILSTKILILLVKRRHVLAG